MMIFGSMIVLHHTRHPFVIAALFSGVGAGILLGNEYVISGLHFALSSHTLWLGAAAASALFFVLLVMLLPSRDHALFPPPHGKNRASAYVLVAAGATVWISRIWLHHCRYIPATDGEKCRVAAADGPSLVVGRHIDYSGLFRLAVGSPTLGGIAMPDGEFTDPKRLRGHDARQRLLAAAGDKQRGFWRNVYGDHFAGDHALARQLSVPRNINLLGLVTLTYGIGQILGPLLTSLLGSGAQAIVNATLCGAVALFIAALISLTQLYKQRFASPKGYNRQPYKQVS